MALFFCLMLVIEIFVNPDDVFHSGLLFELFLDCLDDFLRVFSDFLVAGGLFGCLFEEVEFFICRYSGNLFVHKAISLHLHRILAGL